MTATFGSFSGHRAPNIPPGSRCSGRDEIGLVYTTPCRTSEGDWATRRKSQVFGDGPGRSLKHTLASIAPRPLPHRGRSRHSTSQCGSGEHSPPYVRHQKTQKSHQRRNHSVVHRFSEVEILIRVTAAPKSRRSQHLNRTKFCSPLQQGGPRSPPTPRSLEHPPTRATQPDVACGVAPGAGAGCPSGAIVHAQTAMAERPFPRLLTNAPSFSLVSPLPGRATGRASAEIGTGAAQGVALECRRPHPHGRGS